MTIDEMQKRREELQSEIEKLMDAFSEETGLTISTLEYEFFRGQTFFGTRKFTYQVDVGVKL